LRRYAPAGSSKKSSSVVQSTSASPTIAVCIELEQSRIAKHSRQFVQQLVRQQERVLILDDGYQQISGQTL
jgi:hypothetical protein